MCFGSLFYFEVLTKKLFAQWIHKIKLLESKETAISAEILSVENELESFYFQNRFWIWNWKSHISVIKNCSRWAEKVAGEKVRPSREKSPVRNEKPAPSRKKVRAGSLKVDGDEPENVCRARKSQPWAVKSGKVAARLQKYAVLCNNCLEC